MIRAKRFLENRFRERYDFFSGAPIRLFLQKEVSPWVAEIGRWSRDEKRVRVISSDWRP